MATIATSSKVDKKKASRKWKKIVPKAVSSGHKIHSLTVVGCDATLLKHIRKHPSDVKLSDKRGRTSLHMAAIEGHLECVRVLMDNGAPVEAVDNQGLTALHCACMCKKPSHLLDVVLALVNAGRADVCKKTNAGNTPLHYFVRNECEDSVMFLEVLSLLLTKGANVNTQTKLGETPLHQAAIRGLEQNVMMLLSCTGGMKVDVNTRDRNGETALHSACRIGSIAVARMLLDQGANPLLECVHGTPIELAEAGGHLELVKLLYNTLVSASERAASPDCSPGDATPLQYISFNTDVLEAVESMGHDPSVAVACLYRLEQRGAPTNNVQLLVEEISKYARNRRECSVCLCSDIDALLLPCRHSATCVACAEMVVEQNGQCPICRGDIEDILKIFLS